MAVSLLVLGVVFVSGALLLFLIFKQTLQKFSVVEAAVIAIGLGICLIAFVQRMFFLFF